MSICILVQYAINEGHCFRGGEYNHLEFMYFDKSDFNKPYLLVIKSARWGQEVWLVTFYRTDLQQFRAKRRRQHLYREHL
jgi:hypothetical protein